MHKSDLKRSWGIMKNILNKNKSKNVNSRFKLNNRIIESKEEVSNKFNDIFVNLGKDLANKIPEHATSPKTFLKHRVPDNIYVEPVVEDEILLIVQRLSNGNAGWDGIQSKIVKSTSNILIRPLTCS